MFLALLGGVAAAVGYAFVPPPIPVDQAEVVRGPLRVTVDEDGRTRIRERYIVAAPLSGQLRRIRLDAGDAVRAGETLLAVIEPSDPSLLDPRARAESEARVKAAEAAVQRADPILASARAALDFARKEHERAEQLAQRNGSTRQQLEHAELLLRQRTEEEKSARFAAEIAGYELELAKAALLRTAPAESLSAEEEWQFRIRAPIDGVVLRVVQESATPVTPGTQLLELGDPDDLEVEVDVLSSDAVKISPGDDVLLEHWGGQQPLHGVVRRVEPSAFTKISALGVEEQRVYVLIDLTDPPAERATLWDGFRVEARIIIWQRDDVRKVPTSALFRHEGQWAVFRIVNGHAVLQGVQLGRRNALEAEVVEGLAPGTRVIVHPNDKITDGVAVAPR